MKQMTKTKRIIAFLLATGSKNSEQLVRNTGNSLHRYQLIDSILSANPVLAVLGKILLHQFPSLIW